MGELESRADGEKLSLSRMKVAFSSSDRYGLHPGPLAAFTKLRFAFQEEDDLRPRTSTWDPSLLPSSPAQSR